MKKLSFIYVFIVAALIFSLVGGAFTSPLAQAQEGVHVDPRLTEALKQNKPVYQVIVTFKQNGPVTDGQLDVLKNAGVETGLSMHTLPMVGVLATKSQIDTLSQSSEILSLYLNEKLDYYNADSTAITGVDKAQTDASFRNANNGIPFSGKGIGVVVNDSGVDGTHKDIEFGRNLVENVLGSTNLNSLSPSLLPVTYTEGVVNTDTNSGHGTHVAGTVGGTGAMSKGKYAGAAPGADLIGYGSGAALFVLDGIGGFDYAITNQIEHNIRVITNSWGSSGDFDPYHPINLASKAAYDRGITVLFAAGNEGPGENTHNPYAKAPWVISVAAGVKDGTLADFSSRGTKGVGGTFEMDGKQWTWKDEPSVTAPGVDIISTRTVSPVPALGATDDVNMIEPAYLPYYTVSSGTSMATPHVAGIVALLLEADPTLLPEEVKGIIQQSATNMPGYESWEVGAGYVNAYAAIDSVVHDRTYGETLTINQDFNSSVDTQTERKPFTVDYNPNTFTSDNEYEFVVTGGLNTLSAKVDAKGLLEETGNPVNLVLVDPDGNEHSSGISLLFPLSTDRTVVVQNPKAGTWKVKIVGIRGNEVNPIGSGVPEEVKGTLSFTSVNGFNGLSDISGDPAEQAIKSAVSNRLVDGYTDGTFKPRNFLKRDELAQYLVMGAEIRQNLSSSDLISDAKADFLPFISAVTSKGAAFRDGNQNQKGVMTLNEEGKFNGKQRVNRTDLAYSLVQSLGLEQQAAGFSGNITALYKGEEVKVVDTNTVPPEQKGYVQTAISLNILNVQFKVEQGPYDLEPTLKAYFHPTQDVTRGDYAVAAARYFEAYLK
ncbi:S8 family serine peptidase [Rossellomorea aquimaris]|nr:S8 family serine peptidase [Rossellomorea aquimaris]